VTSQTFRLKSGGYIDRSRPVTFHFGGKTYQGFEGDTLASALLANGVRLFGRSFKYHRPRGLIGAGVEEANALVQLGSGGRSTPNVRATEIALYDGLQAQPVNCWPSLGFDVGGVNNLVSRFLAAGFYYKTFMWPNWHLYEGFIRKAAGIGKAPTEDDPDRYETRFAHCDIAVIGSGPAGLAAARAAARSGARVMLIEQDSVVGGSLRTDEAQIDAMSGTLWAEHIGREFAASPDMQILTKTAAVGYFDHNSLVLLETIGNEALCAADPAVARYRLWQVRAQQVILATGAIERPIVFSGNDRPNIMLAGAVRHYIARHAVLPGRKAVIFTNNDDAYRTAVALSDAGARVVALVDVRSHIAPDLAQQMASRDIPVHAGSAIIDTKGGKAVRAARIRTIDDRSFWIDCDLVAMSGGYSPAVHLFCQAGGKLGFDEEHACFVPGGRAQQARSAGAAAGRFTISEAVSGGHEAMVDALAELGFACDRPVPACAEERQIMPLVPVWHVAGGKSKAFVDFQNDVSVDDIALSARENFVSVEHLKRYTTLGMAADQGKTSNVNALAIMASLTGQSIESTGTTRYRFPFTSMPIGSFAGRARGALFRAMRHSPAHDRHVELGAHFEDYGGWQRPSCYPRSGETLEAAERREARTVRQAAGMFDGSPLGKIEVVGPDAGRFLDLIYANTMSTLKVGMVRYGLMLNELGVIIDDGVATRLAEDRFLICTSSGGATRIAAWLEEWLQCEWLDLDVIVAPVTTAWGVITLTGPKARAILTDVGTNINLSADAFPHMSYKEGKVAGIDVRVLRVSYTGELSYEINVPACLMALLWDRIAGAGVVHGLTAVGVEGWMLLRTEKGYLHIGGDTDGTTTPLDVGWSHVLKKKSDFVGRRSLLQVENQRSDRLGFVGLEAVEADVVLPISAHIIAERPGGIESDGYITSAGFSPTLNRGVALGMIRGGDRRMGEIVSIRTPAGIRKAKIVNPAAYDPEGERLRA